MQFNLKQPISTESKMQQKVMQWQTKNYDNDKK